MNVLLDTHVLIWWVRNEARLGRRAADIIRHRNTTVWISAATVWEIDATR